VTPLQIDLTKYSEINPLSNWLENINYWVQVSLNPTVLLKTRPLSVLSLQK
jgi:hypothetical protein